MAQLRDAQTSEVVAEGAPEALGPLARELGDRVIWDDVGLGFDPDRFLAHLDERRSTIRQAATSDALDDEGRDSMAREAERLEALEQRAVASAGDANAVIDSAQDPDRRTIDPLQFPPA